MVCVAPEGISHSSHLMLLAAEKGETQKVIDYITKTGVPINVKNNYGVRLVGSSLFCFYILVSSSLFSVAFLDSAIIFAANNGHAELLEALVDVGANFEDRSNNWKTPLNWAAHWGHFNCVEYLVGIGANISSYDIKGITPLMAATLNGNAKVVQFLLDNGADPLAKNVFNGTALSIAKVQNNTELISILEPYYPEEPESSPYIIMYNIVKVELAKFSEVLVKETVRLSRDAVIYAEILREELSLQWTKLVERSRQQPGKQDEKSQQSADSEYLEHIPVPDATCENQGNCARKERASDEF